MSPDAPEAVRKVLESGYIGQGPIVDEFEIRLKDYLKSEHELLTLNSCTSALELALHLLDAENTYSKSISENSTIIVSPQTCSATISSIFRMGFIPVWADVDPITGNISPDSVKNCISNTTAAIMAIDWGGAPCDYNALRKFGLPIIEDAAHAFGVCWDNSNRKHESLINTGGDYVCLSFQAIKHLTTGDGGLIKVPKNKLERARKLRWFGLDRRSSVDFRCSQDITESGYKMHMNDISAAIGLANLDHIDSILWKYKSNAKYFQRNLDSEDLSVITCTDSDLNSSANWLFTLLVKNRDKFETDMKNLGVFATSRVHARCDKHTAFQISKAIQNPVPLKGLDYFSKYMVCIPVHWDVANKNREMILDEIVKWARAQ